jgi:hypothetical protein
MLLGLVFREPLFNYLFDYRGLKAVPSGDPLLPAAVAGSNRPAAPVIEVLIDAALDSTAYALEFTAGPAPTDPDAALVGGRAHCVGYAALFRRYCGELLQRHGFGSAWRVEHLRGQLHCGSFNMHHLCSSPFWKEHDICLVESTRTGERHYVDPTLFDAVGIRRVRGPAN